MQHERQPDVIAQAQGAIPAGWLIYALALPARSGGRFRRARENADARVGRDSARLDPLAEAA